MASTAAALGSGRLVRHVDVSALAEGWLGAAASRGAPRRGAPDCR
jgi:hypothetical protein